MEPLRVKGITSLGNIATIKGDGGIKKMNKLIKIKSLRPL
jgi:hypothetical protein